VCILTRDYLSSLQCCKTLLVNSDVICADVISSAVAEGLIVEIFVAETYFLLHFNSKHHGDCINTAVYNRYSFYYFSVVNSSYCDVCCNCFS